MPDVSGIIIGWLSILAIYYLLKHCDDFTDGNVGSGE